MSEGEGAAPAAPEPRLDPPTGATWSTSHDGEWPEGFGPWHRDYDDNEEW